MSTKEPRRRLQLELTPDQHAKLDALREQSGAVTNVEVVRNAVRLYAWWLDKTAKGAEVYVVDADGQRKVELVLG